MPVSDLNRALRMPSPRKPIAACVAALFALSAPAAFADTIAIANCQDSGPGSLRAAVASANSGDILDMSGLACSTITLTTGALVVGQASLTLAGKGKTALTLTRSTVDDRLIVHTGTGLLYIHDLAMKYGNPSSTDNLYGGCILSTGDVTVGNVIMRFCSATVSGAHGAAGGAISAAGNVSAKYSDIEFNSANGGASGVAYGGAIFTRGGLTTKYSNVSYNSSSATGASGSFAGAAFVGGNFYSKGSTFAANAAAVIAGIEAISISPASTKTTIKNSTISGNNATNLIGGIYTNSGKVYLDNSTIAFNTSVVGRLGSSFPFSYYAPGIAIGDKIGPVAVTMQSSLIANNTYGSTEYDLSVPKRATTTVTFGGADNFVRATLADVSGNIPGHSACPRLGALRYNGGPTPTHALLSGSPAIDTGNNAIILTHDQRSTPYARVSGSFADIGAYEVQQDDIVFNNNFEGCPILF